MVAGGTVIRTAGWVWETHICGWLRKPIQETHIWVALGKPSKKKETTKFLTLSNDPPLAWYGRKKYGRLNTESSASVLFLHRDITMRDIYEVKAYRDVTVT